MEKEKKTWADIARELVLNPKERGWLIDYISEYIGERDTEFKERYDSMNDLNKTLLFVTICKRLQDKGVPVPETDIDESSPKSHQK